MTKSGWLLYGAFFSSRSSCTETSVPVTVSVERPGSSLGRRSCRVTTPSISISGTTPMTTAIQTRFMRSQRAAVEDVVAAERCPCRR